MTVPTRASNSLPVVALLTLSPTFSHFLRLSQTFSHFLQLSLTLKFEENTKQIEENTYTIKNKESTNKSKVILRVPGRVLGGVGEGCMGSGSWIWWAGRRGLEPALEQGMLSHTLTLPTLSHLPSPLSTVSHFLASHTFYCL